MTKQIAKYFTLPELCKSQTALRNRIPNVPTMEQVLNLERLCKNILDPVREQFGPTIITSGFRSFALNRLIGSSDNSQHPLGEAGDFEVVNVDNFTVASWIAKYCQFDQLILEFYTPGDPNSGWIHASYREGANRKELLTYNGSSYLSGLIK